MTKEDDTIKWEWLTGSVDFAAFPPSVTVEGYPPLPDEGHVAYVARVAKAFGVVLP